MYKITLYEYKGEITGCMPMTFFSNQHYDLIFNDIRKNIMFNGKKFNFNDTRPNMYTFESTQGYTGFKTEETIPLTMLNYSNSTDNLTINLYERKIFNVKYQGCEYRQKHKKHT